MILGMLLYMLVWNYKGHSDSCRYFPSMSYLIQKTVLTHARELYGVAFASQDFAPARVTSCNSLPLFGPWFTDYNEQVLLINLLKEVERYHPVYPGLIQGPRMANCRCTTITHERVGMDEYPGTIKVAKIDIISHSLT
jgi:hypothetical protein